MLKRMLVLLGETSSSRVARQYAFKLAQRENAELTALAGIDLSYIESPMPGRAGATVYKVRLEEQLKKQAHETCVRLHDTYEQECRSHQVAFEWLRFEGDPIDTLRLASESCDLVVTGHDTHFHGGIREQLPDMLAKLLATTPRPVLVCGNDQTDDQDVLIAYDGSLPAMRAVQVFVLLGLRSRRVHITSIDTDNEQAARRLSSAIRYLRSHGYDVESNPIGTKVHPADVLRIEVAARKIGTIVMGAYGHRVLWNRLFGSTTTRLIESPPCALFVYH